MNIRHVLAVGISLIMNSPSVLSLDRLFTTHAERMRLDAVRSGAAPEPEISESKENVDTVTVNGVFLRKNGKNTAWINRDSTDSRLSAQYKAHKPSRISYSGVTMAIEEISPNISLRPGQVFVIDNLEIKESYELAPGHRAVPATETLKTAVKTEARDQADQSLGN